MMRPRALVGWVGGCCAVGVMVFVPSTMRAAPSATAEDVAAQVVVRLRDAAAAAHQRAAAIAALPTLAYAVATDQQTMLDMTAGDLSFRAQPGESVEVGQVQLRSGKVTPLRREGGGALVHLPLGTAGLHFVVAGDALYAVAVVDVRPHERERAVRGAIGVARVIDLAAASAQLAQLGAGALLRVGDATLPLGRKPALAATVTRLHPPLGAHVDPELTLFVPRARQSLGAVVALAFGGMGLGLGLVLLRRRRVLAVGDDAYHHRASARTAAR